VHTILIIEDNCDILENLAEYLELVGFKILQAHTGKQGVELFTKYIPDLIICDIMMSEMNGYEVLKLLMDHVETNEIPFIFSTSTVEKKDIEEALIIGADNLITKPYQLEDLTLMIKDLIGSGSKRHNKVY
jgi:CheY-like chemotaxis protein